MNKNKIHFIIKNIKIILNREKPQSMNRNKIALIIQREFRTRIRKKSFIIMSILGPFLFAAMIILPIWFTTMEDKEVKIIAVADSTHIFQNKIPDTKNLKFKYLENADIKYLLKDFQNQGYWGVLYITQVITYVPNAVFLYSYSQPSFGMKIHIESSLEKEIERQKLFAHNIQNLDEILKSIKSNISVRTIKLEEGGKEKENYAEQSMIVGYAAGFLIYFFIFLFGMQVMRGVIEEKSNRIVEVIVSSVKPFELMMGKIIGIAGVALVQFIIWIVLTASLIGVGQKVFFPELGKSPTEKVISEDIMNSGNSAHKEVIHEQIPKDENTIKVEMLFKSISDINYVVILSWFLFYFIGGYLLYASLFAAIGSTVDNEADTQQFMLPVTIPLILAIYVMINTMNNPDSNLSFWFSMIPLTSPIVMMVRIPFFSDGMNWQLIISAVILVLSFIGTTWLAGKIYRTGILMYGKKASYRELWKWIKYKN